MQFRRLLLRAMLAALAISAICGVLAAFNSTGDLIWRVIATAFCAAITLAIMLALSFLLNRPFTRIGAIAGMLWIIGLFLLFLALIWSDLLLSRSTERLAEVITTWIFCGLPATLLLLDSKPSHRPAVWTSVSLLAASFLIATFAFFLDSYENSDHLVVSAFTLSAYGLLISIDLLPANYRFQSLFRLLGIALTLIAFYIALLAIWNNFTDDLSGKQFLYAFTGIAAIISITHLVALLPLKGWQILARFFTLAVSIACIALINLAFGHDIHNDLLDHLIAATGIVAACSLVALFVMGLLNRRLHFDNVALSSTLLDIDITCPRCSKKQILKLNGAECAACQLRIDIRIEEPRCPNCGYLLYMLTSNLCPECGTQIAPAPLPVA